MNVELINTRIKTKNSLRIIEVAYSALNWDEYEKLFKEPLKYKVKFIEIKKVMIINFKFFLILRNFILKKIITINERNIVKNSK